MLISRWGLQGPVFAATLIAIAALGVPRNSDAGESGTVEEIVGILRDKGLIDEAQQMQLLARHEKEQAKAPSVGAKLMEGIEWSGDLRLRHETFWFDHNANGVSNNDDRYRARYRARLGLKKQVNEWARVGIRLASGGVDNDSTNRTLGNETVGAASGLDDDVDFGRDSFFIDRAWAEFMLPEVGGLKTKLVGGKVANPFLWKHGTDILIWDPDINPEGAYLQTRLKPDENTALWLTAGGFDVEERSSSADGMLYAVQVGGTTALGQGLSGGIRTTLYEWRNLDASQLARTASDGNINTQTFDIDSSGLGDARIGEVSAFLDLLGIEDWPMTFYGTYAKNFDARSVVGVDDEDEAWGFGLNAGDKKKLVKLGVGYFHAEANSLVSTFIDSDLFDANTNRKGLYLFGQRQLGQGVDFKLTYFDSDEIKSSAAFAPGSLDGADRKRLQADMILKF